MYESKLKVTEKEVGGEFISSVVVTTNHLVVNGYGTYAPLRQ